MRRIQIGRRSPLRPGWFSIGPAKSSGKTVGISIGGPKRFIVIWFRPGPDAPFVSPDRQERIP